MKKHPTEKDHTLRLLVREARPIWKWLLLGCLISIVMIACSAAAPKLLGGLIDRLLLERNVRRSPERAQIEDIVIRKTGIAPENIVISTLADQ